ncbi:ornithine cyclodeaminase family protein [Streptomyces tuirus]|uniref:Ornithine cyclodeaminase family protein n=1 Tax=Streptomyces tuirus TaxID=68278 RepID=A0A941FI56_9ACTN|nr:ornithine cyclodeaminase family protein [Streptomyces tuirus]
MSDGRPRQDPTGGGQVRVLSTKDVAGLIDPDESIAAIEAALSEPQAMSRQSLSRRRLYVPVPGKENEYYWHNNMVGAFVAGNTLAVRLDVSRARVFEQRQEFPGDFTGLVLLYDLEKSQPYAIVHDHGLSPIRVAATSALATRELAASDAAVLGIIGTGEQAVAHALAHAAVMPGLTTVLYYSRSPENRMRAARRTQEETGVAAEPVSSVEELMERSHVLVAATNATEPVFDGRSLRPGQHVVTIVSSDGFVQRREVDDHCFGKADVIVVNSKEQIVADQQRHFSGPLAARKIDQVLELTDVLSGEVKGRTDDSQISLYDNNVGLGVQFAAVGALAYQKARAAGIGVDLPVELFVTRKAPDEFYAP